MTSVPKPLKFLRPHYDKLKEIHAKITDPAVKVGVLSVKSFSFVAFKQICKLVCIAEWKWMFIELAYLQKACADVISVLGMTVADGKRDCLQYKLLGVDSVIDSWGHEYVR